MILTLEAVRFRQEKFCLTNGLEGLMKNRISSTGSFLRMQRGNGDAAAQRKAKRALLSDWANMPIVANFADADEVLDPTEAQDYIMSATNHLVADEGTGSSEELDWEDDVESDEASEPEILFEGNDYCDNMFDPEPTHLGKNDAKQYVYLAAPASRGRTLRI